MLFLVKNWQTDKVHHHVEKKKIVLCLPQIIPDNSTITWIVLLFFFKYSCANFFNSLVYSGSWRTFRTKSVIDQFFIFFEMRKYFVHMSYFHSVIFVSCLQYQKLFLQHFSGAWSKIIQLQAVYLSPTLKKKCRASKNAFTKNKSTVAKHNFSQWQHWEH